MGGERALEGVEEKSALINGRKLTQETQNGCEMFGINFPLSAGGLRWLYNLIDRQRVGAVMRSNAEGNLNPGALSVDLVEGWGSPASGCSPIDVEWRSGTGPRVCVAFF